MLVNTRVRDVNNSLAPTKLILLSTNSRLTKLLLTTLHSTHSHARTPAMMSIISSTYYIPGLRNQLKKISRACSVCQRAYARPLHQQMGLLPFQQTTSTPPFYNTGIDYAGPFIIKQGHTRKPVLLKTYACLFVCLATRAIHIELSASLSTDDFLATLRRFMARRGCSANIYTDNGTCSGPSTSQED